MTTLARIDLITRQLDRSLESLTRRPDVQREIEYFRSRIGNIKSVDDFMKDDRIYRFAMRAFGLGDMIYAKAFVRRALTEGIDDPDAFASRLVDPRYRELVEAFNFQRYGEVATIFDRAQQGTIDRYVRQTLEENEGEQDDNVRLALYFQRKASGIGGPFDILADKALTRFMYAALGLPATTSALDVDRQANLLASHLDFSQLDTPENVGRLITRFAALADANTPTVSNVAAQLLGSKSNAGIGVELMLAMQNLKG